MLHSQLIISTIGNRDTNYILTHDAQHELDHINLRQLVEAEILTCIEQLQHSVES